MLRRLLLLLLSTLTLTTLTTLTLAAPSSSPRWYEKYHQPRVAVPQSYYEALSLRRQVPLSSRAVRDVVCLDPNVHIILHDENAAALAICGSLAGAGRTRCEGAPASTEGRSGGALFTLRALDRGAGVAVAKADWVACVAAARMACPTGSLSGVCLGGATRGDVGFTLTAV